MPNAVTQTNVMMLSGILAASIGAHFTDPILQISGGIIMIVSLYRYVRY